MKNRVRINRFIVALMVCVFFFQTIGNITARAYVSTKNEQQAYSIKNISFTYTDYRYPDETRYFNGNDGKSHILVFGGVSSCFNTICTNRSIKKLLEKTDGNVVVNIFDIANNTGNDIIEQLNDDEIPQNIHVSKKVNSLYSIACDAAGISGSFTMPIVCYVDKNGNIQKATTGYCSYDEIFQYAVKYTSVSTGIKHCVQDATIEHSVYYSNAFELLNLINQERVKNGLSELEMDKDLLDASVTRALECSILFCDIRPDGSTFDTINPKVAREILIPSGFDSADKLYTALFNASQEKSVLLDSKYKTIGISKIENRYGKSYWALCFGTGTAVPVSQPADRYYINSSVKLDISLFPVRLSLDEKMYSDGDVITYNGWDRAMDLTLDAGAVLNNKEFTFTSSNPEYVRVSDEGRMYFYEHGQATLTVTKKDDPKQKLTFTIINNYYKDYSEICEVGESVTLYRDSDDGDWISLDPDIVSVRDGHIIVGLKEGLAFIEKINKSTNKKTSWTVLVTKKAETSGGNSEDSVSPVTVSYRTHVQSYGWQDYVRDGAVSGTSGKAKRLEAINISIEGNDNLGIQYTTHCQSYGWLPWSSNGEISGTEGEAKRLEAIKIQLTGADKDKYDVYYRVHAQSYGWLGWAKNGAPAGTAGYAKRLEAIQIVVVKKGESFNTKTGNIASDKNEAYIAAAGTSSTVANEDATNIVYRTHVQSYGWQGWKYNGQMSGTFGQAKRLEGINIKLTNKQYSGSIVYTTHVQTYGWQGNINNPSTWKKEGQMAGTSGQAKRLEAICIRLTGEMEQHYDIYYRVHAQTYGWLGWTKNGAPAGTAGLAKRLEGIQIVLVPKGGSAPAGNYGGVSANRTESYIAK